MRTRSLTPNLDSRGVGSPGRGSAKRYHEITLDPGGRVVEDAEHGRLIGRTFIEPYVTYPTPIKIDANAIAALSVVAAEEMLSSLRRLKAHTPFGFTTLRIFDRDALHFALRRLNVIGYYVPEDDAQQPELIGAFGSEDQHALEVIRGFGPEGASEAALNDALPDADLERLTDSGVLRKEERASGGVFTEPFAIANGV